MSSGTNRSLWLGIGLGLLVGLVVTIGAVVLLNGEDGGSDVAGGTTRPASTSTRPRATVVPPATIDPSSLDPAGRELLALLQQVRRATFHARYATVDGPELTLEIWSEPPEIRQDTLVPSQNSELREIHTDGTIIACIAKDARWNCANTGHSGILYLGLEEQLPGKTVVATDGNVRGRPGRCFTLKAPSKPDLELCFDQDGVPTRIHSGNSTIELDVLDKDFPDDLYEPPVEPVR